MDYLPILNQNYPMRFDKQGKTRDGGGISCAVFSGNHRYFLRVIKPAFFDTAAMGADVQVYLQSKGFPVPPVVLTKDAAPSIKTSEGLLILYEFIEGSEPNPDQDAEMIGAVIGKLHRVMSGFPGQLAKRDKPFYIDRYIDLLRKKQYMKADEFMAFGESLWDKVKGLPRAFCHGDMYAGNIHKTPDGSFYILDFDTSCEGFPMYDAALICNRTHYFDYDECGYGKSKKAFSLFLQGYAKHNSFSQAEIGAFFDMIALYHFALQATILEVYGLDSCDNAFLDNQLDWLYRWREQCNNGGSL